MLDIVLDTLMDVLKLIPFLFIAFLLIELIEHKFSDKSKEKLLKSGKIGPLAGGLLGVLPQCGFSVMATDLYVGRIITLGTLIAVYLSTSDEMLPILISERVELSVILKILLIKVLIGIVAGFIIDFVINKKHIYKNKDFDICEDDDCHCEKGILHSTIVHTLKTLLFILIITFILNVLMHYVGENAISKIFMKDSIFAPFLASLVGLIPNCGSSIALTELYLNNALSYASLIAGLLTNSGIGLLVLFRSNKDVKENLFILTLIYLIGVISGIVIEIISMFI